VHGRCSGISRIGLTISRLVEAKKSKEEYDQLPFVEDVSKYRWTEEEEVRGGSGNGTVYLGDGDVYGVRRRSCTTLHCKGSKLGSIYGA
jgi:hypothetical protein